MELRWSCIEPPGEARTDYGKGLNIYMDETYEFENLHILYVRVTWAVTRLWVRGHP